MSNAPLPIGPPTRYGDLTEFETIFAAGLPQLTMYMAGLIGKRTPRTTKKIKLKQSQRLHRFLHAARPYLLGLRAVKGEPDKEHCVYALMEGLLREQFRAGGKRVPDGRDAFEFLLKAMEQTVRPPHQAWTKSKPYSKAKQAMFEMALYLHQQRNPLAIEQLLCDWAKSKDAKKFFQFTAQWPTLARQFRRSPAERLTMKLATQLANEYRTCASFLEQRLRLFVWLDQFASGTPKKWEECEKATLFELLKAAETSPRLAWLTTLIDRNVRNALAHGQPEVNLDLQECRFHDRAATVVWKMREFFENARQLTLSARALVEFESILGLVQIQVLVTTLWGNLARAPLPTP